MAALISLDQADVLCSQRIDNRTWQSAYSERKQDGTIAIRFLRWQPNSGQSVTVSDNAGATFDSMNPAGAWDETTDDSIV
jgi:hypothetical protein